LGSISITRTAPPPKDVTWQVIDVCERLASAALLTVVSPVLAGSAVAVSLLSGRAPLIAHRRVGWNGAPLWMLKLRTMWSAESGAEPGKRQRRSRGWVEYIQDETGPECKEAGDPRVTSRFARFCRRHSIDELPQLWHVVRGEMALVGPRPVTASELRRHYGEDTAEMLSVKPGIAGLWQVRGRNRLTYRERRELDLQMVRNRSFGMYLGILLRTLPEVLRGNNSW
jgi:lipopolysaccharide/colanic/teichoic acid biosynthesis glycosyltransferase